MNVILFNLTNMPRITTCKLLIFQFEIPYNYISSFIIYICILINDSYRIKKKKFNIYATVLVIIHLDSFRCQCLKIWMKGCCLWYATLWSQSPTISTATLFGRESQLIPRSSLRKALHGGTQPIIMVKELASHPLSVLKRVTSLEKNF